MRFEKLIKKAKLFRMFSMLSFLFLLNAYGIGEEFTHFEKGIMALNQGKYSTAIEEFLLALTDNPNDKKAQFNLAIAYEKKGDYNKSYYAWKRYLELDSSSLWAQKAKEHMESIAVTKKVSLEGLNIKDIKIGDVFPSIYKFYSTNPVGYVEIENSGVETINNLRVSLSVKKYMDYPTESKSIDIYPGEKRKIDLFAVFNNQILEVTEDTPFIAQITFSFNEGGENREKSQTTQFILHNRNAMTWEDQEKIASFVTAKDPAIRFFARAVLQMFKGEEVSYIHNNLLTAMQVFDAIGAYGVRYVEDPVTPYAKISETKDVIDYIQYPIDTLRVKSGDCDDDVVLYTTLLESIGIQTALVDFPGHVVAMFNTGVTVEKAHLVNPNRNQLIIYENNIWVPVEVTMFGKTFAEAWYSAANRFNTTPEEKRKIIKISRAWDKYPPVTLLSSDWEPTIPDKKKISELLDLEIKTQYNARKKYIEEKYNEYFKISPVDYRGYNVLGIIYGEHMLYRDAIEYFEKAIKLKPDYLDAHINLGYAYYKNKQFDESLSQLLEAIKYEPDNANLNYNIGIIYAEKRNFDVAIKYLKIASVLDENYRKSYEYLASAVGGGRAGSVSSLEMDIKWRD